MEQIVFPVFGFSKTDDKFDSILVSGTCFFVGNDGYIFSAAHNFKKHVTINDIPHEMRYFAYIEGQLYKINILYSEYDRENTSNDSSDIYKDFVVGRIDIDPRLLNKYKVNISDRPVLLGFSIRDLLFKSITTIEYKGIKLKLFEIPITVTDNVLRFQGVPIRSFRNMTFYSESTDFSGLSGCAVIFGEKVIGLLTSKCFIQSEYLIEKAREVLNIEFVF